MASHAIGSVPFLIRDGNNGLIYQNGNREQFESKVELLLKNNEYRKQLGINAYKSIISLWNADNASERLMNLAQQLGKQGCGSELFDNGPCSDAKILAEKWYDDSL